MRVARQRSAAVFARPCNLVPAAWAPFLGAAAQGHLLWAASVLGLEDSGALIWCSRCGAYTPSGRACGLLANCAGRPVSVGASVRLLRLRAKAHPLSPLQLARLVRILPLGGGAAEAASPRSPSSSDGGGQLLLLGAPGPA